MIAAQLIAAHNVAMDAAFGASSSIHLLDLPWGPSSSIQPIPMTFGGSVDFKEKDGWAVHDPRLRHRFFEVTRSDKILGLFRAVGIEQDDDFVLVIGRAKYAWIG